MILNGRKLMRSSSLISLRLKSKSPLSIHDIGGNFFKKIPQSTASSSSLEENIKKNFHEQNLKYPLNKKNSLDDSTLSSPTSSSPLQASDDLFFYLTNSNDQPYRPSATFNRNVYSTLRTFNHPYILRHYLEIYKHKSLFNNPIYENMYLLLNKFINSFSSNYKTQSQYYMKSEFSFFDKKNNKINDDASSSLSSSNKNGFGASEYDKFSKKINKYNYEKILRYITPNLKNNVNLIEINLPSLLKLIQKDINECHEAINNSSSTSSISPSLNPSNIINSSSDSSTPSSIPSNILSPIINYNNGNKFYYNYNNLINSLGNDEKIKQELLSLSTILNEFSLPHDSDQDMIVAIGKRKEEEINSLKLKIQSSINLLNNPLVNPILFNYSNIITLKLKFFNVFLSLINTKNPELLKEYDDLLCEEFDRLVKMEDILNISRNYFDLTQLNSLNHKLINDGISTIQLNNFYTSIIKNNSNFSLLKVLLSSSYILELNSYNRNLASSPINKGKGKENGGHMNDQNDKDLYKITKKLINFFTDLKSYNNNQDLISSTSSSTSPRSKLNSSTSSITQPQLNNINNIFYICFPVFLNQNNGNNLKNNLDTTVLKTIHDNEDIEFNSMLLNYFNIIQSNYSRYSSHSSSQTSFPLISSLKISLYSDLSNYTELNLKNNLNLPLNLDTLKTIWEILPNFSFSNSFNLYRYLYDNVLKSIETNSLEAIQSDETINSLLNSMISSKFISSNILNLLSKVIEYHGINCTNYGFNIFSSLIKLNQFRFSSLILNNILEHWDFRAEKRLFSIYNNIHLFFDKKASEELLNFFRNNLTTYTSLRESSYWITPELSPSSSNSKNRINSQKLIKNNDEEILNANKIFAKSLANDLILATIFFGRENKFSSSYKFLEYMELVLQPYAHLLNYNQCVSLYHSYAISRRIQPQLMNIIDKNFHQLLNQINRNSLIDVLYSNAKLNRSPLYLDEIIKNILQDNNSIFQNNNNQIQQNSLQYNLYTKDSTNFSNLFSYNESDFDDIVELINIKSNDYNSNPTANEYQQFVYDYSRAPLYELTDITGKLTKNNSYSAKKKFLGKKQNDEPTTSISTSIELSPKLKSLMSSNTKYYNNILLNNNFNNNNLHMTDTLLSKFLWSLSLLGQLNLKTFLLLNSSILNMIENNNTNNSTLNQLLLIYEELNSVLTHIVQENNYEEFFQQYFSYDNVQNEEELLKILQYNLSNSSNENENTEFIDLSSNNIEETQDEEKLKNKFSYDNYFNTLTINEKLKLKFLIYSRIKLNEFFKNLSSKSSKLLTFDDVSSSRSHLDLSNILKLLCIPHENEKILPGGTIVDIFIPSLPSDFIRSLNLEVDIPKNFKGFVIEFDGPLHYDSCCGVSFFYFILLNNLF